LQQAIVDTVQATRDNPIIQFGASTRAALMLQKATRAWAILNSRNYAIPDDLRHVAPFVLLHRLKFHAGAGEAPAALEELMQPAMERAVAAGV
jgi:MoxR-like ATPase